MKNTPKLAIQLFSVRNALAENFDETVGKLAEMGFQGVELAFSYGGRKPDELAALFARHGLEVVGIYETLANVTNPRAELYDFMKALGCRYVTFGISPKFFDEKPFAECAELARRCVGVIRGRGFTPLYHAHTHEFVRKEGAPSLLDRLYQVPELADLPLEADTCWLKRAGLDVAGYLEENASRIPLIHVKDLGTDDAVTEIGRGVVDFKSVADFAKRRAIPWLIYELDFPHFTECESARMSIDALRPLVS